MNIQTKNGSVGKLHSLGLLPYPIDVSRLLNLSKLVFDETGIPRVLHADIYHPVTISQFALILWNKYLATDSEDQRRTFITQAEWLVKHSVCLTADIDVWPNSNPNPDAHNNSHCLSALVQGIAVSVLVRAYQLTQNKTFLDVARRAIRSFEFDILDGGVSTPIGENSIFFEEVNVYPAAHKLSGCFFALLGIYDYLALSQDTQLEELVQRCLTGLHTLLPEFDVSYWTHIDLLHRDLASPAELFLQSELLEAVSTYSGCEHCTKLAARWKSYWGDLVPRLRYYLANNYASLTKALWKRLRKTLLPEFQTTRHLRVCVPIHAFPVTGGTRAVIAGMTQVMSDEWQIEYLTQHPGSDREGLILHTFGKRRMSPWQFPMVWLYFSAGFRKLMSLLRRGANYHIILPQDGLYTSAFAGLVGKLAGRRVVCIDHGNLSLIESKAYRNERLKALASQHWIRRLVDPFMFPWYWLSLHLFARIAAQYVDHFLIPGVEGDGVEETCKRLGILPSRITRFPSMVNTNHYAVPDVTSRKELRERNRIAGDALIISIVCRLAPEKGLDIAIEAISQVMSTLPIALRKRTQVIIAGDGPLRKQIEEEIHKRSLGQQFLLWGEASTSEVTSLLVLSDIFLYTSTRGACFSMAILEAMAAGCAVVASTLPISNVNLLADGRGIAIPPGDVQRTAASLVQLLENPELRHRMGSLARDYITLKHNSDVFKRVLTRVTYWQG